MKQPISGVYLICITIILASCNSQATPNPIPATEPPTADLVPSLSTGKLPTSTSAINLATPTISVTPISTLSPKVSESEVRHLLEGDPTCVPPCFLGVIPEKTTVAELMKIFLRFGLPLQYYTGRGIGYRVSQFSKSEVPPETEFNIQNGLVTSMRVEVYASSQYEWSLYSPSAMLSRLGVPSEVTFGLEVNHDDPGPPPWYAGYSMTFYYNKLNLIIQYGYAEITLGDLITVCPNRDTFEQTLIWLGRSPNYAPSPLNDGPLEKVTTFTPERFRDYLLLGRGACFYLKSAAIPIY